MVTTTASRHIPNLAFAIAGQTGVVPFAEGDPGVAKSAFIEYFAKRRLNRPCYSVLLDTGLPEDIGGYKSIGTITHDGREVSVMKSYLDEHFIRATLEPSVIFFDELTNCRPAMQAAALQIIQKGIPGTFIYSAGNPVERAANGCDFEPPMVNRLCVLPWETPREAIRAGWRNGFDYTCQDVLDHHNWPVLPENWQASGWSWGLLLDKYADHFPRSIHRYPENADHAHKPWPSWRSWTNAGILLGAADSVGASIDVKKQLVTGCVGEGPAIEFFNWIGKQDFPDPEALLRNPGSLDLPEGRADAAQSILVSVVAAVAKDNSPSVSGERWEAAHDVLDVAHTQMPELAMAASAKLWRIKPGDYQPRKRQSSLVKALAKHAETRQKAGAS